MATDIERLTKAERQELLNLRMHYIDSEQLIELRTWQAMHPANPLLDRQIAVWRMAAMDKWSKDYPLLSLVLFGGES